MYKTQTRINGILIILWFVFLVFKIGKIVHISWWWINTPILLTLVLCIYWTIEKAFIEYLESLKLEDHK